MKSILFVDDETRILGGVKRMLHSKRAVWRVETAEGSDRALEILAREGFDVVVSDVRMPFMDGVALLERVKEMHPSSTRIILSGQCDTPDSARAATVAHQFLSKPCSAEKLIDTLTRALALQDVLASDDLRRVVGNVRALPSPPHVFQALSSAVADPDVDLQVVVDIVNCDVGLSAKVLQLVNSSFFGLGREICDVHQAISYLGLNTLKQIVLGAEIFGQFEGRVFPEGFDLQAEEMHAAHVARLARDLAPDKRTGDAAFTAGMLHDIGELVLAGLQPAEHTRIRDLRNAPRDAEQTSTQADLVFLPARLGAYLLGVWGLPGEVVEAVLNHDVPGVCDRSAIGLTGWVHIADRISVLLSARDENERVRAMEAFDHQWLETVGAQTRLPDWIERATKLLCTPKT